MVRGDGAVIATSFDWQCDFDFYSSCLPTVTFTRIDNNSSDSQGFNFRYVREYYDGNGTLTRDLIKLLGVKIVVFSSGKGGKFTSPIPGITALGVGLALLSAATVIADVLLIYVLPKRHFYKNNKIAEIGDPEEIDYEKVDSIN